MVTGPLGAVNTSEQSFFTLPRQKAETASIPFCDADFRVDDRI